VLPNNTIRSEQVAELRVSKRETGQVRDAYRRGWFLRWMDTFSPF
jgi:flagellar L-ring protein precursor FlgH